MTGVLNKSIRESAQNKIEKLLLLLIAVYLIGLSIHASNYQFPLANEFMILLYMTTAVVAVRIIIIQPWNKKLIFSLMTAAVYLLAYHAVKNYFLLFLAVLCVGTIGINYRRIVKLYTIVVGLFCLFWILSSFVGLLPNIVYYRSGHLRSSWGMAYPTDFASLLLFLLATTWLAWDRVSNLTLMLSGILLFFFSWRITDSRTTMICCVMICIIALIHITERWAENRRPEIKKGLSLIRKLMVFAFPIGIILTVLSVVAYAKGNELAIWLNEAFSQRLALTYIIFKEQGIHAFGKAFPMVGNGGTDVPPLGLYFLDSSYSNILICHGWVTLLALCILWVYLSLRAYKQKDYKLLSVLALIAFHAFTEHHFKDINYNILLATPFASILVPDNKLIERKYFTEQVKNNKPVFLVACVEVAAMILALPIVLGRMRTLLDLHGEVTRWGERFVVLGWIAILLSLVIILATQICSITNTVIRKRRIEKRNLIVGLTSALLLVAIVVFDSMIIHDAAEKRCNAIEAEDTIIQTILSEAKGKVVVEDIPEIYKLHYGSFYRPVYYGDDLARLPSVSIITNRIVDRQRFVDCGFLYTPISDQHAVYSNDPSIIDALTERGYLWTDYYSETKTLDLKALAEDNEVPIDENGIIVLNDGISMTNGPWVDLQQGWYLARFHIVENSKVPNAGDKICVIDISDYYHARVLASKTVYEEGSLTGGELYADVEFYTTGSRAVEFCIYPNADYCVMLSDITYQKTAK